MLEIGSHLIKSLIFFLACIFVGAAVLVMLAGGSAAARILVPGLFILMVIAGVVLTFVPFFKDKLWLIPIVETVIGLGTALIIHFL